jgi:hypothetical protein
MSVNLLRNVICDVTGLQQGSSDEQALYCHCQ